MRAWLAIWVALFASLGTAEARADADADLDLVPLADGEAAPADAPNYFDARELGAGALTTCAACRYAVARDAPELAEPAVTDDCECFADTARLNIRAGRPAAPSDLQAARCLEVAQGLRAPLASPPGPPIAAIADTFQACVGALADGVSGSYAAFVCSCATDAWLLDRTSAPRVKDDFARCEIAGRYRERTGQNPTLRQFTAIHVARAIPRPLAEPGTFIPYAGNGGGPTLCSDGMYSHSSGRGTCAHHHEVAGGQHRRR